MQLSISRELTANIIDIFENYLDSKGVKIANPNVPNDSNANIYGAEYDDMMLQINELLETAGVYISNNFNGTPTPESSSEDVYVQIFPENLIMRITEGSGDNLDADDIDAGYVDYLNYDYVTADTFFDELGVNEIDAMTGADGGMLLTEELVKDKYNNLAEAVDDVLDFAFYKAAGMTYRILGGGKDFVKEDK